MNQFKATFLIIATIVGVLLFCSNNAHAESRTMNLDDEYTDGGKTLCIYSDGRGSKVLIKKGAGSCPSVHTFDSED